VAQVVVGDGADEGTHPEGEEVGHVELDLPHVVEVALAQALTQADAHVEHGAGHVRRSYRERGEERRHGVLDAHRERDGQAAGHAQMGVSGSRGEVPAQGHGQAEDCPARALCDGMKPKRQMNRELHKISKVKLNQIK
jgi:hypothetical protein